MEFRYQVLSYSKFSVNNDTSLCIQGLDDATRYFCRVRSYNTFGESDFSNTVSTKTLLKINSEPAAYYINNIKSELYAPVIMSVYDTLAVAFQWYKNGIPLENVGVVSGANNDTLKISSALYTDEGLYYCVATYSSKDDPDTSESAGLEIENPLPIELLSFQSVNAAEGIELLWSTATETNNAGFTVEKSDDGLNFYHFTNRDGAGFSSTVNNYKCTDTDVKDKKTYYYRLRQTDNDGNSKIVAQLSHSFIFQNSSGENEIYYSATGNSINFNLVSDEEGMYVCRIYNQGGRILSNFTVELSEGRNTFSANASEYKKGSVLIVELLLNNNRTVKKIIIS